jgi:hypothetical protein
MESIKLFFNEATSYLGLSEAVSLVLGALLGVAVNILVNRPRLFTHGNGGGGVRIKNQPRVLGFAIDGKAAKDLRASLRSQDIASSHTLSWQGEPEGAPITIEPGGSHIVLLPLQLNEHGYCLTDHNGQPIVQYTPEKRRVFILTLQDRFGRSTVIKLSARYEHNKAIVNSKPTFSVFYPGFERSRWSHLKEAGRHILQLIRGR